MDHLLDCAPLGEDSHVAPPYTNMGEAPLSAYLHMALSVDQLALRLDQQILFFP